MKKLLYIAFVDFEKKHYGVNQKIISQSNIFEKFGYLTETIIRKDGNIQVLKKSENPITIFERKYSLKNDKIQSYIDKQNQYKAIKEYINSSKYDLCYIRYDLSSSNFIKFLSDLKKNCDKIILEIPTFPYEKEYNTSPLHKGKLSIDRIYRKKLKLHVDRVVTYYNTDKIFNIQTIKTINGFEFSNLAPVRNRALKDEINIIAVASMRSWHGYERFIKGMYNYYKDGGEKEIFLHLVGNGPEILVYKELSDKLNLSEHVLFHGILQGEKLNKVFEICDIGIDSLARHKTNISILSSLKSREYGAKGLPFINSCKIDVIEEDFKYLLRVPEDDSPIDINQVVNFYNNIYMEGKEIVISQVRNYLFEKSSMHTSLKPIVNYLKKN